MKDRLKRSVVLNTLIVIVLVSILYAVFHLKKYATTGMNPFKFLKCNPYYRQFGKDLPYNARMAYKNS
jgi:hypothetical protein